jgi:hypothetical protein
VIRIRSSMEVHLEGIVQLEEGGKAPLLIQAISHITVIISICMMGQHSLTTPSKAKVPNQGSPTSIRCSPIEVNINLKYILLITNQLTNFMSIFNMGPV